MKNLSRNKGFSLVELIIVIAIMAILAMVIAPAIIRYIEKSREATDIDACDEVFRAMSNELLSDKIVFDDADPTSQFKVTVDHTGMTVTTVGVTDPTQHTDAIFKSLGVEADASNQFFSVGLRAKSRRVSENQTGASTESFNVVLTADGEMTKNIYFPN